MASNLNRPDLTSWRWRSMDEVTPGSMGKEDTLARGGSSGEDAAASSIPLGDHDTVLPFLGTQTWVRSLNYPIVDDWRAWHVDVQSAEFTVAYGNNLTFATVKVTQLKPHKVDVKTVDSLKIALGYVTLSTVNNQDSTDLGWTITAKPSIILMNEMVTEITY
uniref:Uncharacterized protein n=2 Tax=Oryza TaxID=4527 RepID=A0A0D3HL77_9ORYZ